MSTVSAANPGEWISAREAGKLLGICRHIVPRVAIAEGIRRKAIGGTGFTRYCRADVIALAERCVVGGPEQPERAGSQAGG